MDKMRLEKTLLSMKKARKITALMNDKKIHYNDLPPLAQRVRRPMARDLRRRLGLAGGYLVFILSIPFVNGQFADRAMGEGPWGLLGTWIFTGVFAFGLAIMITALQVFLASRGKGEAND